MGPWLQEEDAQATMKRMMENKFDFNDFLHQFKALNNMGGAQIMKLMPGFNKVMAGDMHNSC
jgi:signal recognition particle subunit SRP54